MLARAAFLFVICCIFSTHLALANDRKVPQQFEPPINIEVTIYHLDPLNGSIDIPITLCQFGHTAFGCTADSNYGSYPYIDNPVTITIDDDYLLDVVSHEMKPTLGFSTTALKAQAVVARTFAFFFDEFGLSLANDAGTSQVFLPYAFEALGSPTAKWQVERAVNIDRYMSYNYTVSGETLPIRSEYSADIRLGTEDCDFANGDPVPYQRAVDDPISSHPNVVTDGNPCGFSQKGASRWAYGNLGFANNLDDWSTRFARYEQILAHYYTGIHLRTTDANVEVKSSEYRWNPLAFTWGPSNTFPSGVLRLQPNTNYSGSITVQNTSTDANGWRCDVLTDYRLVYTFVRQTTTVDIGSESVCDIQRGESVAIPFALTTPNQQGTYSLKFDIYIVFNGAVIQKFSEDDNNGNDWNKYGIPAIIGDATADSVFLPILNSSIGARDNNIPTAVKLDTIKSRLDHAHPVTNLLFVLFITTLVLVTAILKGINQGACSNVIRNDLTEL